MRRQQLKILQQMARDGVDPKKPFEFVNGNFVQLDENSSKTIDEITPAEEPVELTPTEPTQTDNLVEDKTPESELKKKKTVKPKQKQEKTS